MKRFIVALVVGFGLFAQSAHAIEFYWVLMKANNFTHSVGQWGYKLHKEKAKRSNTPHNRHLFWPITRFSQRIGWRHTNLLRGICV